MSSLAPADRRYTPAEYLALERAAEFKSEYVTGQIYALAGASRAHNLIVLNVASIIHGQLRGRPCEAYVSDMRVRVSETGLYTYPDVAALCGEARFEDSHLDTLVNPSTIVEVLSESTESYDRGENFAHYRRLATLREYLLVAQDRVRAELYVRQGEQWVLSEFSELDATVPLPSIDCALSVREIYQRVEFGDDGTVAGQR
jgi:Uma2 family endonuclease